MMSLSMAGTGTEPAKEAPTSPVVLPKRSDISATNPVLPPPDYESHVLEEIGLRAVFSYINPSMLYGRHLGLKGSLEKLLKKGDPKARELLEIVSALQEEVIAKKLLRADAVYRYFPVMGDGNDLVIYDPADPDKEIERFHFERMNREPYLCIADFARPLGSGAKDNMAVFVTTAGKGVRELAEKYKANGEYLKSHALQALALESAEAAAEWLHLELRKKWGMVDDPALGKNDIFQAKYQGIRVSFGYPACPNLADQEKLWRLIEPERHIGVKLTEGMMMDPEASVSALAFHHPDGQYFSV
jgi:5-methyltetrahydrofolate--homocysteine methyltransferase